MVLALLFAVGQFCGQTPRKADLELKEILPRDVLGWSAVAGDAEYTAETLHQYIDGASEIYRLLNVRHVVARRFAKPGAPDIVADVFEMKTASDAFGAYHHDIRDGAEVGIGQESEYSGSTLAFWKDRYFICVTAGPGPEPMQEAVVGIGGAIAAAISEEGTPPRLVSLLPAENLRPDTTRYFHNHFSLNLYYYVADENLLDLDMNTEGVLARYATDNNGRMVCVVVQYPEEDTARGALARFTRGYLPEAGASEVGASGAARTENGKWAGAKSSGNRVFVVFDAPTQAAATGMLEKISKAADRERNQEVRDGK